MGVIPDVDPMRIARDNLMTTKTRGSWFEGLFGLVFLIAGLVASYSSAGQMIVGYIASSNWVEAPATIRSMNFSSESGSATYSYHFNGATYNSDHLSLNWGSDNFSDYWLKLESRLRKDQRNNELYAFVNPKDPTRSLLDRSLRWQSILFGLAFFISFCGSGGYLFWKSIVGVKTKSAHLREKQHGGIMSSEKQGSLFLAAFGLAFLTMGIGASWAVLPKAIESGEYLSLIVLLFVFAGVWLMATAFKGIHDYRRFGDVSLFLDPSFPGVGGQLGGRFSIKMPGLDSQMGSSAHLMATLICNRVDSAGEDTSYTRLWQKQLPVNLKQTAKGIDASFLFDIPDTGQHSQDLGNSKTIVWSVVVEGDFGVQGLGEFQRSWDVLVEQHATQRSRVASIPQGLLDKAEERSALRAKNKVLKQVQIEEDSHVVVIRSNICDFFGPTFLGFVVGFSFLAAGVLIVLEGANFGYFFGGLGGLVGFLCLYALGKSIRVTIDKQAQLLSTRVSWFGIVIRRRQGNLKGPHQFELKSISTTNSDKGSTESFTLNFKADGKTIQIVENIEGEKEALALKQAIAERAFPNDPLAREV